MVISLHYHFINPFSPDPGRHWQILGVGVGIAPVVDLCSVQNPQSVPLCVCWLPLPPPPIPEIAIFILPCLLSVTLTHQKHTKLISPKFLLVRDSVCVFLVISTFVKIYKVSLEKPEHRVVHLERLRTCTHTHAHVLRIPAVEAKWP